MLAYNIYDVSVYGESQGSLTLIASFACEADARRYFFANANANLRLVFGIDDNAPWIERVHGALTYGDL